MFPKKDKNEFSQVYSIEIMTFDLLVSCQPFNKKKNSTHENLQGHKMLSVRSHHRRWYLWSGHDLRDEEDLSLTSAAEKKPSSSRVMRYASFDWMDTLLQFERVPQIHYRRYSVITSAEKKPSSSRVMRHASFDWMDTLLQFERVPQIHYRRYSVITSAEKKPSSSRVMRHASFDWMDTLLQFERVPQIHYRRYSVITSPIRFWIGSGSGPSPPPEGTAKRGPGGPGKPRGPATPGSPFSPKSPLEP